MLRTMQIVFPVATNIQMEVIERYGFPSDGEGDYFLIQQLKLLLYQSWLYVTVLNTFDEKFIYQAVNIM